MVTDINLKYEVIRKLIHISTAAIPMYYSLYGNKNELIYICLVLCIVFLLADLARIYVIQLSQIYEKICGKLLRTQERKTQLNGATLLFFGFFVAVVFLKETAAITVMLFLSISDSIAAIVGKSVGRNKLFNKTLEGSAAFFFNGSFDCLSIL